MRSVPSFAVEPYMIVNNDPVIHVYNTHEIEEAILTGDVTIFNIHFPELVYAGNAAVSSQSPGVFYSNLALLS